MVDLWRLFFTAEDTCERNPRPFIFSSSSPPRTFILYAIIRSSFDELFTFFAHSWQFIRSSIASSGVVIRPSFDNVAVRFLCCANTCFIRFISHLNLILRINQIDLPHHHDSISRSIELDTFIAIPADCITLNNRGSDTKVGCYSRLM